MQDQQVSGGGWAGKGPFESTTRGQPEGPRRPPGYAARELVPALTIVCVGRHRNGLALERVHERVVPCDCVGEVELVRGTFRKVLPQRCAGGGADRGERVAGAVADLPQHPAACQGLDKA